MGARASMQQLGIHHMDLSTTDLSVADTSTGRVRRARFSSLDTGVCKNNARRPSFQIPKRQRLYFDKSEKCATQIWVNEVGFET